MLASGVSIYDLIHQEDHPAMHECYAQLNDRRVQRVQHEVRAWKADGSVAWLEGTVTDMLDDPNVHALVHNYRDISARKQAEITHLEFAALIEHEPFVLFSEDTCEKVQSWNIGAERSFGYAASEIIGQPAWILVPADIRQREGDARTLVIQSGTAAGPFSTVRLHKSGSCIALDLTLIPMIKGCSVRGVLHFFKQRGR